MRMLVADNDGGITVLGLLCRPLPSQLPQHHTTYHWTAVTAMLDKLVAQSAERISRDNLVIQ